MLGAIVGDVVGSIYEWHNHRNKFFPLFDDKCFFTDDSVMTIAVSQALMECNGDYTKIESKTIEWMQSLGREYPDSGYGGRFNEWLFSEYPEPYNSYGNGAAMKVSACGWMARTLKEAKILSKKVTEVTHNHPEGIKGAEAVAVAIYLARNGRSIKQIRKYITKHYYSLDFTLEDIRETYEFNETCQDTVPQAIEAFLESKSFEDAIRNAISIGGDSDTIAAITGSIAEAYYGIPDDIKEKTRTYLDERLLKLLDEFEQRYSGLNNNGIIMTKDDRYLRLRKGMAGRIWGDVKWQFKWVGNINYNNKFMKILKILLLIFVGPFYLMWLLPLGFMLSISVIPAYLLMYLISYLPTKWWRVFGLLLLPIWILFFIMPVLYSHVAEWLGDIICIPDKNKIKEAKAK